MYIKKDVFGVRCSLLDERSLLVDEELVLIGGRRVAIKRKHLGCLIPVEKFAVSGESPFYLKMSGIFDFFGPDSFRRYKIKVNSRGYLEELFVHERELILVE